MLGTLSGWLNWAAWTVSIGWLYWLTTRQQKQLDRGDRQQDVIDRKLAAVPSKSAPRTEGPRFLGVRMESDTTESAAVVNDAGLQILDQPSTGRHHKRQESK